MERTKIYKWPTDKQLEKLVELVRPEMIVLSDITKLLAFWFKKPIISKEVLQNNKFDEYKHTLNQIVYQEHKIKEVFELINFIKESCKSNCKPIKELYMLLRLMVIGRTTGPSFTDVLNAIGLDKFFENLKANMK